jgi:8-oxo-dGTP pyrophosphatase MutT (NUDIX family)
MYKIARIFGRIAFWLGRPFFMVYFRIGKRTRVLLVRGENVLVVSGWLSDGRWNLPGGGLHRGEDPAFGAARELKEELGVDLQPEALVSLGEQRYSSHGYSYSYTQFVATISGEVPLKLQRLEIARAEWRHHSAFTPANATSDVLLAIRKWQGSSSVASSG